MPVLDLEKWAVGAHGVADGLLTSCTARGSSVHLNFSADLEVMWEEDAGTEPSRQTSHHCKELRETRQNKEMMRLR